MVEVQAPDSGRNDASNRALENWSALLSRCPWIDSIRGLSHDFCLKADSPFGSTSPLPVVFHFSTSADTLNGAKSVTDERIASTSDVAEVADEM